MISPSLLSDSTVIRFILVITARNRLVQYSKCEGKGFESWSFTVDEAAGVKQRRAVCVHADQSSEHLEPTRFGLERELDNWPQTGWTRSHIDHVLEGVEPSSGTDLISVMEKWRQAVVRRPF